MAEESLIQRVLGERFAQLQGPVKTHFSLVPDDPAKIILAGQMDRVWHPGWLTLPMWLSSFQGVLFPETGQNVPVRITIEARGLRQQWHRIFDFGQRQRIFRDAMVYDPAGDRILNFFGNRDQFAMVFHFAPLPNGGLEIIGGQQYVYLGGKRLAIPRLMTPALIAREWPVGENRIRINFTMHHPLIGQLYEYSGQFTVKKELNDV